MGTSVSEATVKAIKSCYKDELRKQQTGTGSSVVKLLQEKKHGQTLLLSDELDKKLQLYLRRIREDGGPVTAGIAIAAARGLLMAEHKNRLVENGGHIKLNRHWVYGFFRRMGFVQRKPTTAKSLVWRILLLKRRNFLMNWSQQLKWKRFPQSYF